MIQRLLLRSTFTLFALLATGTTILNAQVTTNGFLNLPRTEAIGTLLSHPVDNDSEPIGRTTSLNYLNGWIIVGGEAPGSRPGSDLLMRVYDIEDPENPIRRLPTDFNLTYPENRWHQGNMGWNAHGSAQYNSLMLPSVTRVETFGGPVELGGTNGIPELSQVPVGYNRSSQAGPWDATLLWYNAPDADIEIRRIVPNEWGYTSFQTLGTIDHVGEYGGGDWHPMFFGDLLIMARSGAAARDGVVVYRLEYRDFDDTDPENDSIVPHYIGSLDGGFHGYWPNLFSDGTGLYVIGSTTDILIGADISEAADPDGSGAVQVVASLTVPDFTNASYPAYQDSFGFMHNRKVDMTRFLAGDPDPIVLTLDEEATGVNTSQISLPVGNLWLTGGYPIPGYHQGMGIWVHQQEADTTPPRVAYHIPQSNRTEYPRFAPLSFLIHEHTRAGGPRNGIDFTVRPVLENNSLGDFVPGFLIHDFSGNLTFTPDEGLAADTTFQVDFLADPENEIGFRDAAGNYIEPYSFRFATGGGINATQAPTFTNLTADSFQPSPDTAVSITATATGESDLEYRFNFEGSWSDWSSAASAAHTYTTEGRPRVLAQVRDETGNIATDSLRLLVLTPPDEGPSPTQSSSMAIGDDNGERRLWSVNPDTDTVAVLDAVSGTKQGEFPVGKNPRSIARDTNGLYWVACQDSDEIHILNPDGSSNQILTLDYGTGPFGIAPSPDGQYLYVSGYNSSTLLRFSASSPTAQPLEQETFPTPRSIAISPDGQRVLVTRFISPELEAEVSEFSENLTFVRTFSISSSNTVDGGDRSAGVPNYLSGIAISPDGSRAAIVSKQDNTQRGAFYGVADLTHETTVRSVISFLDLEENQEIPNTRRDFDNSDRPSAVTYSPLGDTLFTTLQGSNRVVAIDALNLAPVSSRTTTGSHETSPAIITIDQGTGLAPQGVLIDSTTNRLFTQDLMGRSVTVRDASPLLDENRTSLPLVVTTDTVETETFTDEVLLGKQVFYNAADTRMSADGYISCASCHDDGGHDGRVWDFSGRGEGFRRTTDLRGRSGLGHGNVHWSGNFDEIQDFEHDMRGPFGGEGFLDLSSEQFAAQHPSPASGKAGSSPQLDAIAAYVASLGPADTPRSPTRNTNGSLTESAIRGREIFTAQNCTSCHSGDTLTNSQLSSVNAHTLSQVGSLSQLSGSRLGGDLAGIDTPTLHGLHAARNFLHHGQAETLEEVFSYAGGELIFADQATHVTTVTPEAVETVSDDPTQGGGGTLRGAFNGTYVYIDSEAGATTPAGLRFSSVDGGENGGAARISIRYAKHFANGSVTLDVNGSQQSITMLRQQPDNSWQTSGWRWVTVDTQLNPAADNSITIYHDHGGISINAILVSNSDDFAQAQPHRLVQDLDVSDQEDLMAYLLQLDGRDSTGTALPAPSPPDPLAPAILESPSDTTLAIGNTLSLTISAEGTGPFTYQWYRDNLVIGEDSPTLQVIGIQSSDTGTYSVQVSNNQGSATSDPIRVTVNPVISITTAPALSLGTIGQPYSTSLAATGGISNQQWEVTEGVLPPGLNLSENGVISGIPTQAAQASFSARVSDNSGSDTQEFTIAIQPISGFDNDPDLLLHYRFDEGSGNQVWDLAPNGNNHSTSLSEVHWTSDGRFGGAYGPENLSDDLHSFFPQNQTDLDFDPRTDEFTFSIWVRTTANDGYNTILGKDQLIDPRASQLRIWKPGSGTRLQAVSGNQYGSALQLDENPLSDGEWHMITLVNQLEGDVWRTHLYFDDGSLVISIDTGSGGTHEGLLAIGNTSRGGNPWRGQLDDLRIYSRALSVQEIEELYQPVETGYTTWISSLPNPPADNAREFGQDPDADGISNLFEYLLGGDPNDHSNAPHSELKWVTLNSEQTELHFVVHRNLAASGWRLVIETSTNLSTWDTLATALGTAAATGPGLVSESGGSPNLIEVRPLDSSEPSTTRHYRVRAEPIATN